MAETTHIAWAHGTFNPLEGCEHVSPGCDHCFAEARDQRYSPIKETHEVDGKVHLITVGSEHWGPGSRRKLHTEDYWRAPVRWDREAEKTGERRRIFCGSLCDVGEDHPDWIRPRERLMGLIRATPRLIWLLLTKRPENLPRLFWRFGFARRWPANVWVGATAENQAMADKRVPLLREVPARVRFLSVEPMLERVDLEGRLEGIHWVICGGESGSEAEARPLDLEWAREINAQCCVAGVPFFFKQAGRKALEAHLTAGGAKRYGNPGAGPKWRLDLEHKAGADPSEWPLDLRVQEVPT